MVERPTQEGVTRVEGAERAASHPRVEQSAEFLELIC